MEEYVKKDDNIMDAVNRYPEIAGVLGDAGLHCVGCHVSTMESIADGALGHGMSEEDVEELMEEVNLKIEEYDKMPKIQFLEKAVDKLKEKLKEKNCDFIRIVPSFGGFDFEASKEKYDTDAEFESNGIKVFTEKKIERAVRGVKVDWDESKRDFIAVEE
jgi:iron-sulfur cluster assembly protein